MKKFCIVFLLGAIALFSFASCSKTRDGLGLDTIRNSARTGSGKLPGKFTWEALPNPLLPKI
ncbi:hypothetical protein LWM68_02075 [Niabella sp. W65]|nr:hypothetical protein [Niabella sp. W65]MCH7361676.1 hypothetical protein [Niabella sp. W65]